MEEYSIAAVAEVALADRLRALAAACEAAASRDVRERLADVAGLVEQASAALGQAVVAARADDASWGAIGDQLGVSWQAAHRKFAPREAEFLTGLLLCADTSERAIADPTAAAEDVAAWLSEPFPLAPRCARDEAHAVRWLDKLWVSCARATVDGQRPPALPTGVDHDRVELELYRWRVALAQRNATHAPSDARALQRLADATARLRELERAAVERTSGPEREPDDFAIDEPSGDGPDACRDCEFRFDAEAEEAGPVYECGQCGEQFTPADGDGDSGNRCPTCNLFARRIADARCPECESLAVTSADQADLEHSTRPRRERSRRHDYVGWCTYVWGRPDDETERRRRRDEVRASLGDVTFFDYHQFESEFLKRIEPDQVASEPYRRPDLIPSVGSVGLHVRLLAVLISRAERSRVRITVIEDDELQRVEIRPTRGRPAILAGGAFLPEARSGRAQAEVPAGHWPRAEDGSLWMPKYGEPTRPVGTEPEAWAVYVDDVGDDEQERDARVAAALMANVDFLALQRARELLPAG